MTVTDPTEIPAGADDTRVVNDPGVPADRGVDEAVEVDVLVEEISIDGMCGVY